MMRMMNTLPVGAALAALTAAAPAAAQINPHAFGPTHGYAADRCTAAVQYRLSQKTGVRGFGGQHVGRQVVGVTRVDPRRNSVRVTGLAVSDRLAWGPYGAGAYGAVGGAYSQTADMTFRCTVDYRGQVLSVDINRR